MGQEKRRLLLEFFELVLENSVFIGTILMIVCIIGIFVGTVIGNKMLEYGALVPGLCSFGILLLGSDRPNA